MKKKDTKNLRQKAKKKQMKGDTNNFCRAVLARGLITAKGKSSKKEWLGNVCCICPLSIVTGGFVVKDKKTEFYGPKIQSPCYRFN